MCRTSPIRPVRGPGRPSRRCAGCRSSSATTCGHLRDGRSGARSSRTPVETMRSTWLDAADASGMPVDPRLWLASPPASSYPACLAVKAAAEQGSDGRPTCAAARGPACRPPQARHADALRRRGARGAGLDVERFAVDLGRARSSRPSAPTWSAPARRGARRRAGRARIPSLAFRGEDGQAHAVHDSTSPRSCAPRRRPPARSRAAAPGVVEDAPASGAWPPRRSRRSATCPGRGSRPSCGGWRRVAGARGPLPHRGAVESGLTLCACGLRGA